MKIPRFFIIRFARNCADYKNGFIIFAFSGEKILFEKALCSKPVTFLSGLTPYAFLIHLLTLSLVKSLMTALAGKGVLAVCLFAVLSLVITLALSLAYQKLFVNKLKGKKAA